jgi:ABC-type hemin transport system ATPase subunit
VSHDLLGTAAIADRMVFINRRTVLFEGPPAEVLRQSEVREAFGLDIEIPGGLSCPNRGDCICPTAGEGAP